MKIVPETFSDHLFLGTQQRAAVFNSTDVSERSKMTDSQTGKELRCFQFRCTPLLFLLEQQACKDVPFFFRRKTLSESVGRRGIANSFEPVDHFRPKPSSRITDPVHRKHHKLAVTSNTLLCRHCAQASFTKSTRREIWSALYRYRAISLFKSIHHLD